MTHFIRALVLPLLFILLLPAFQADTSKSTLFVRWGILTKKPSSAS